MGSDSDLSGPLVSVCPKPSSLRVATGIFSIGFPPGSSEQAQEEAVWAILKLSRSLWLESHEPMVVMLVISANQKLSLAVMCSFDE